MQMLAVGFWGAFFGSAALALTAALLAFTRSARRVALTGSLAAVVSAAYALVFLGWVPVDGGETLQRLQALTSVASAAVLAVLLFLLLGTFRSAAALVRAEWVIAAFAALASLVAWLLPPARALALAILAVTVVTIAAMIASAASARRGERAGWLSLAALSCVCVGMSGLDWYAFHPDDTPWQLHAASAVAGIAYLLCIGTAMWTRYAYLIEVSEVMTQGPDFDAVTRMAAYRIGQSGADALHAAEARPAGIIAVSIANLKMLEELHGRAAYNHALFVCASRLRRLSLPGLELRRLPEDGFLLLFRHPRDVQQLIDHARNIMRRLSRPVLLGMSREIRQLEAAGAVWEAVLGLGVLIEDPGAERDVSIAGARAMSRTAWSYPSRMAWYDEASEGISELPAAD